MSLPTVKELEANVQRLIEERLPDENWKRAHGRVDSPDDGGFEGYWYDTKNPVGTEALEQWLPVRDERQRLFRCAGVTSCTYSFEPGGVIQFEYKK